jgi:hypothetical protein
LEAGKMPGSPFTVQSNGLIVARMRPGRAIDKTSCHI